MEENGRITEIPPDQVHYRLPAGREIYRTIKCYRVRFVTFRNQVDLTVFFKNEGITQMILLIQDDLFVLPGTPIGAFRQANVPLAGNLVVDFEKHVPTSSLFEEKRICHKPGSGIHDVTVG